MTKYKSDLDILRHSSKSEHEGKKISLVDMRSENHNVFTNPMPFNMQNPYILRDMGVHVPKNPSYLASKGSQNIKMA